jgi:hypothetical protein
MSATSLGFLATLMSTICLVVLAAFDPRRAPERAGAKGLRRLATALAILPGVLLVAIGEWAAFLIWLGAIAVLGWIIAAVFSAFVMRRNSRADRP